MKGTGKQRQDAAGISRLGDDFSVFVSRLRRTVCFRWSEAYFPDVASDRMITTLKGNFGYVTTRSFPPVEVDIQEDGSVIGKQGSLPRSLTWGDCGARK